jgi:hypothetical protein
MPKVWLYSAERKRGPIARVSKILPRHAYASLSFYFFPKATGQN